MSAELYTTGGSAENEVGPQNTTVGGSKPLHRFIRGQPKLVGIIILTVGSSFFIISMAINVHATVHVMSAIPPGFVLGPLFIICGIMYILAEHNPTKKAVTISLAITVVTILMACWNGLNLIVNLGSNPIYRTYDYHQDNATYNEETFWYSNAEAIAFIVEAIFTFYTAVGIVIFIVMSSLAGAALRSTKSQAVIMMTAAAPTETQVE